MLRQEKTEQGKALRSAANTEETGNIVSTMRPPEVSFDRKEEDKSANSDVESEVKDGLLQMNGADDDDQPNEDSNRGENRNDFLTSQMKLAEGGGVIQRWPDWADDAWNAATDAVEYAWDTTTDVAGYAWDTMTDVTGAAAEAALRTALRAIHTAEELLSWLSNVSSAVAHKAIDILMELKPTLLVDFLANNVAHPLADYILRKFSAIISTVRELVDFIAQLSSQMAERVLQLISSTNIQLIVDFVMELPRHALAAFAAGLLRTVHLLQVFERLAARVAARIIRLMHEAGKNLTYVVEALAGVAVETVREILNLLGQTIVEALRTGYTLFIAILKRIVDYVWPIGYGISLEAGLGATFGIPLYIGGNYVSYIQHRSEEDFFLFRRGQLRVGADTGVGAGAFVGLTGGGQSQGGEPREQWGVGAEVGAQAGAGLQTHVIQEFNFPIYQDAAFMAFIMAATASDMGVPGLVNKIVDTSIPGINIDPMRYNTRTQFEFGAYAEASAEAGIGIRTGGIDQEGSANGSGGGTWNQSDTDRPNRGSAPGPWYNPMALLGYLRASANASLELQAGLGVEMRQSNFTEDEGGYRVPSDVEVDFYGQGQVAANINMGLPSFIPVPISGLGVDSTMGLKVTIAFHKNASGDITHEFLRYTPYFNTGDMDLQEAPASETELSSTGSPLDFESFLAGIDKLKHKRRIGLGSQFGRSFLSAQRRQQQVRTLLGNNYRGVGGGINGFLTYEFEVTRDNLRLLLNDLMQFYREHVTDGQWENMIIDFIRFFQTGTIPQYMIDFIARIVSRVHITELKLRLQAQIGIAGGGQVSEGLKLRLHGSIGAGIFRESDLLSELGDGALTQEEIRDLLVNGASYAGLNVSDDSPHTSGNAYQTPPATDTERHDFTQSPDRSQQDLERIPEQINTQISEQQLGENQENLQDTEEFRRLQAVKYEMMAHGLAYSDGFTEDQRSMLRALGYMDLWFGGAIDDNAQTGFFAGLLVPQLNTDQNTGTSDNELYQLMRELNRPVLAFRGSETEFSGEDGNQFKLDWLNNDMDPIAVGYTAFQLNYARIEAKLRQGIEASGKRVAVVGHSLGGSLAKQAALHFPQYIAECVTFQAPGISAEQEQRLEDHPNSTANINGDGVDEDTQAFLDASLNDDERAENRFSDMRFESHTAEGDIVHHAGSGRIPSATRIQHDPAGWTGRVPISHTSYLTSSREFDCAHDILYEALASTGYQNLDTNNAARTIYSAAKGDEMEPMAIDDESYITDSTLHQPIDALRRGLIGDTLSPHATLINEYPSRIPQIPLTSRLVILQSLLNGNELLDTLGISGAENAILNMFRYSAPSDQLALVNGAGGFNVFYNKLNNLFNANLDQYRLILRKAGGYFSSISVSTAVSVINRSMDSGIFGFGDDIQEKIIRDILVIHPNGRGILIGLGNGNYDDGLERVLRKLQGAEDRDVSAEYSFENRSRGWFW